MRIWFKLSWRRQGGDDRRSEATTTALVTYAQELERRADRYQHALEEIVWHAPNSPAAAIARQVLGAPSLAAIQSGIVRQYLEHIR